MRESVTLKSPVMIDGERVRELSYDVEKIGTEQFMEAEARAGAKALATGSATAKVVELDAGFHLYLGIMAVLAENPGWTVEDVERVKGPDILKVMRIGRSFMTSGAEEAEGGAGTPEAQEAAPEAQEAAPEPEEAPGEGQGRRPKRG